MPAFKELDPEVIRKALEGEADILTPALKKEEAFFRNYPCPRCDSASHETFVNARTPFTAGALLSNKLLRCLECRTEFDPGTGLITRVTTESDSPSPQ